LTVLGLGLAVLPAHAQSTAPSLMPITSFGQESFAGSAYDGVSFGLAPFVGGRFDGAPLIGASHGCAPFFADAFRFRPDPFGPPCFVAFGHLSDERWGFGRRMSILTLRSWNSYDGTWAYVEWCPYDRWWAYLVSDLVVSLLDRRYDRDWGPPVVWVDAPRPRVTYKEPPDQRQRHAKPRSVILEPIPHVRPLLPLRPPRSVPTLSPRPPRPAPPRGQDQPSARRGRSILGSVLGGLGRAAASSLGRAVGRAVTGSSEPEARGRPETHKERGSTRSARPRTTERRPTRSSRPSTAKRRGSGGGRSW
jgi:hypothetical protein